MCAQVNLFELTLNDTLTATTQFRHMMLFASNGVLQTPYLSFASTSLSRCACPLLGGIMRGNEA